MKAQYPLYSFRRHEHEYQALCIYIHSPFTNPSTILEEKQVPFSSINLPNLHINSLPQKKKSKANNFASKLQIQRDSIEEKGENSLNHNQHSILKKSKHS